MLESLERFAESNPAHKQIDPEQKQAIELPPRNVWWKSMWRHHRLYHYHRLVAMMVVINVIVFYQAVVNWNWFAADGINLGAISNMAIANIGTAILFRSQYFVNLLFKIATSVPTSWPLRIRQMAGKVYPFLWHSQRWQHGWYLMVCRICRLAVLYLFQRAGWGFSRPFTATNMILFCSLV